MHIVLEKIEDVMTQLNMETSSLITVHVFLTSLRKVMKATRPELVYTKHLHRKYSYFTHILHYTSSKVRTN